MIYFQYLDILAGNRHRIEGTLTPDVYTTVGIKRVEGPAGIRD